MRGRQNIKLRIPVFTQFLCSPFTIRHSLSLSKQCYCTYRASCAATFHFLPKIYAALDCPGAQKEICFCRRKLHLPETKEKRYYFH